MRMTNYGKSFRIQSENPTEATVIFEAGKSPVCPHSSGIMMDNGRGIDFDIVADRVAMGQIAEWLHQKYGDRDAWAFDTLCQAAIRGDREAVA